MSETRPCAPCTRAQALVPPPSPEFGCDSVETARFASMVITILFVFLIVLIIFAVLAVAGGGANW